MPRPRKVEKKVKPKEEKIVVEMEDTYSGIKKEDSGVILKATDDVENPKVETIETPIISETEEEWPQPKELSKREKIDALLANPCTFYPDPTRLQYGTEMWPWLKQLSDLLE